VKVDFYSLFDNRLVLDITQAQEYQAIRFPHLASLAFGSRLSFAKRNLSVKYNFCAQRGIDI
jgi:hypothetical protein